jgi:hypothetical protein
MHSYICIVAPYLGTLDASHGGHDVELNLKMVLVDPSRRWKDPQVHIWSGDVPDGAS